MPRVAGVARAVEGDGLAVHLDRAGRRLVDPGEDLDERRLSGAVVAEQAQNLAAVDFERDVVKYVDRAERLVDAGQLEQWRGHERGLPFARGA